MATEGVRQLAKGQTLAEFRDPQTGLLWPAEEKLVEAARTGEPCDLHSRERSLALSRELNGLPRDGAFSELAAECVASRGSYGGFGGVPVELGARMDARGKLQAALLREFLFFCDDHPKAPVERPQGTNWAEQAAVWQPCLDALIERFGREVWHWRAVDLDDAAVRVRADVLRVLLLGNDPSAPVHELGVQLFGAHIVGRLNLTGADDVARLDCQDCYFESSIDFREAKVRRLRLSGSRILSLDGVNSRLLGGLYLSDGFRCDGQVWLSNAEIQGNLELDGATLRNRLSDGGGEALQAYSARITGSVFMGGSFSAEGKVSFGGCEIGGSVLCPGGMMRNRTPGGGGVALVLSNASIGGDVSLIEGFYAAGMVTATGSVVEGDFGCRGGVFRNRTEDGQSAALALANAEVKGDVFLADGFLADGGVTLYRATVSGIVFAGGGTFRNKTADGKGSALSLAIAVVHGAVGLVQGFKSEGEVDLQSARIGNVLDLRAGHFENLAPSTFLPGSSAPALSLALMRIDGAILVGVHEDDKVQGPTVIRGSVILEGAHVRLLVDEPEGWPERRVALPDGTKLYCDVRLDSFTYDRFGDTAPTDAKTRLAWLERLPAQHLAEEYRPQPFAQLAKVLTEMGHADDAKIIRRRADRYLRVARWHRRRMRIRDAGRLWARARRWVAEIPTAVWLGFQAIVLDRMLSGGRGLTGPVLTAVVMLVGAAIYYEQVALAGGFVPREAAVWTNPAVRQACAGTAAPPPPSARINWHACQVYPRELPKFYALAYSADLMLPFANLGQKLHWRPRDEVEVHMVEGGRTVERARVTATEIVTWAHSTVSLALYVLLAALAAGWIKRE